MSYYAGKNITIIKDSDDVQDVEEVEVYILRNSIPEQLDNYVIPYTDTGSGEGSTRVSAFSYSAQIPEDAEIGEEIQWHFVDVYSDEEFFYPELGPITVENRPIAEAVNNCSIYIGIGV